MALAGPGRGISASCMDKKKCHGAERPFDRSFEG
jgi:hypothetical protein